MSLDVSMSAPPRVLVTGATGFIGSAVVAQLRSHGWRVRAASRVAVSDTAATPDEIAVERVVVGEIGPYTDWSQALTNVSHVVHAAGLAHTRRAGDEQRCVIVNVQGTERLAAQASAAGVRRMVLLSSVKVQGEATHGVAFGRDDVPQPEDHYARSKLAAEQALWSACARSRLEGAVVRLPLVYGPHVKANFAALMRVVDRGWPLPFGSITNRRSFLGLETACAFIECLLVHPAAVGHAWLMADLEPLSTPALIEALAEALGKPSPLVRCPVWILQVAATLLGRRRALQRLTGSLEVNTALAAELLRFQAPSDPRAQLLAMVRAYRDSHSGVQ